MVAQKLFRILRLFSFQLCPTYPDSWVLLSCPDPALDASVPLLLARGLQLIPHGFCWESPVPICPLQPPQCFPHSLVPRLPAMVRFEQLLFQGLLKGARLTLTTEANRSSFFSTLSVTGLHWVSTGGHCNLENLVPRQIYWPTKQLKLDSSDFYQINTCHRFSLKIWVCWHLNVFFWILRLYYCIL